MIGLWRDDEIEVIDGKEWLNTAATERFFKVYPDYAPEEKTTGISVDQARKIVVSDRVSKVLGGMKFESEEEIYEFLAYDFVRLTALPPKQMRTADYFEYGDSLAESNLGHAMDHDAFMEYIKGKTVVATSKSIEELLSKTTSLDEVFYYITYYQKEFARKKFDKEKVCTAVIDYIHGKGYDVATGEQAKELAEFISNILTADDTYSIVSLLTQGCDLTNQQIFNGLNEGKSFLELVDPKAYEAYQEKEEAKRLALELSSLSAAEITDRIIKKDKDLIISQLDKFYDVLPEEKWNEVEEYLTNFVATVFGKVSLDPNNEKDLNKIGTILATICKFQEDTKSQLFNKIAERLGLSFESLRDISAAYAFGTGYKGMVGQIQNLVSELASKGDYKEIARVLSIYKDSEDVLFNDDFYHQLNVSPAVFRVKLTVARLDGHIPMPAKDLEKLLVALQHCNSENDVKNVIKDADLRSLLIILPYLDQKEAYYNYYLAALANFERPKDEIDEIIAEVKGEPSDEKAKGETTEQPRKATSKPEEELEEVEVDSLDEDERKPLRIQGRRKPKTAHDKKKVIYGVVAGVGIISLIFMTHVLHQGPTRVVQECASTFGRLLHSNASLGELMGKLGNLTAYFGSALAAFIGGRKLGKSFREEDIDFDALDEIDAEEIEDEHEQHKVR